MNTFWETKFRNGGALWSFEPSDSAIRALDIFTKNGFKNILIPGTGYGRNAIPFIESGITVTGIEISETAIEIARSNKIACTIHHGSVTEMPFDNLVYDGVFCYALLHLLNKYERKHFLKACFSQLKDNGLMIFVLTSKMLDLYGKGRGIGKERFEIEPGLKVFFYDPDSILKEFSPFGLTEYIEIEEPVKFLKGLDPMKLFFVVCRKNLHNS